MKAPLNLSGALFILCALLPACSPGCFLKPDEPFKQDASALALDYSEPQSWAAHPERPSRATMTPAQAPSAKTTLDDTAADVFYLYPTAWFDRGRWNDPLNDAKALELVDQIVIPSEASAFNQCCRVYSPRYRQATLGAFYGERADATKAFALAYADVERAFDAYLAAAPPDRPLIIAGHSQGSMHALRLLARIDQDPALYKRLVVAYLPGYAIPLSLYKTHFEHIKPCERPEQTGCIAAWDTYREGADVDGAEPLVYWSKAPDQLITFPKDSPRQCTNPITWRADKVASPKQAHLGAVVPDNRGEPVVFRKLIFGDEPLGFKVVGLKKPMPKLISARCDGAALRVPDLDDVKGYPEAQETQPGNYHLLDYELFYMDISHNALERVRRFTSVP